MSIVKESKTLRVALEKRLIELYPNNSGDGFKQTEVIKDATERGFKIAPSDLSKYFKGIDAGGLSELQCIWLAIRYGIPIKLQIGIYHEDDDKGIRYIIPKFNESQSLKQLKTIFV